MRHSIREAQRPSWRGDRKRRIHDRRPTVESLEKRALLSTTAHLGDHGHALAVHHAKKAVGGYSQINLVSDLPGAQLTDTSLKNPWGIAYSATSPFWVSDAATGVATIYTVTPANAVSKAGLTVTCPGGPTGQVFNNTSSTSSFLLTDKNPAAFIFDTLSGNIVAWDSGSGKTAQIVATTSGATFTGLAIGSSGGQNFLYAADGGSSPGIKVFDSSFHQVTLAGNFVDPKLKKGFAKTLVPFNVQSIGGELFVTYRGKSSFFAKGGAVAEFNTDGTFVRQLSENSAGGKLQAPWGVVMAPSSFGKFSNDLLVGNFANGRINALKGTKLVGQLTTNGKKPLVIDDLWALGVGNNTKAGSPNFVYFTAGINDQGDGLFGAIQSTT